MHKVLEDRDVLYKKQDPLTKEECFEKIKGRSICSIFIGSHLVFSCSLKSKPTFVCSLTKSIGVMKSTVAPSLCSLITHHLQSVWDSKQLFPHLPGSPGRAAQAPCKVSAPSGWSSCRACLSSLPAMATADSWGKINLLIWCTRDCHTWLLRYTLNGKHPSKIPAAQGRM